jgi:hypothetical protein
MNKYKIEGKEHIHIPGLLGNGGMLMDFGKTHYEEYLESSGIYLTDSDITSLNGETYNTKEFIIGLDSLDKYIRSQLYVYVNEGVNSNNSDSVCESLINRMDDYSYYECLRNVEHLKEMVDEFYEQIKNK